MNNKLIKIIIFCLLLSTLFGEVQNSTFDTYYFNHWNWLGYDKIGKSEDDMLFDGYANQTIKWQSVWDELHPCRILSSLSTASLCDELTQSDFEFTVQNCSDHWNNGFENGNINYDDFLYWWYDDKIDLFKIVESNTSEFESSVTVVNSDEYFDDKYHTPGSCLYGDKSNYSGSNNQFRPTDGSIGIVINATDDFKQNYIWRCTDQEPIDDGNREGLDIWTVIIHEMGHLAGLAHSDDAGFNYGESVMYHAIDDTDSPLNTLHKYDCEAVRLNYFLEPSPGIDNQIMSYDKLSQNRSKK